MFDSFMTYIETYLLVKDCNVKPKNDTLSF